MPDITDFILTPADRDAILRNDFASFMRVAIPEAVPGIDLVWGAYPDLIASRLADVVTGKTTRLIITLPPRHLKSLCASVALPAFFHGHHPSAEIMMVSYGQDLARGFGELTQKVMLSPFYERIFDTRLISSRQSPQLLRTTRGGVRRATSIDGMATGVGADLLGFDDPQKAGETLSEAIRRATNSAYENTFLSRLNDPATSRIVIVMQRLHEDDFVGHVVGLGGEWEWLNLPAIAEEDEVYPYETFLGRHVFRRSEGGILHPGRFTRADYDGMRAEHGEARWATLFQQRPTMPGGGHVKVEWFLRYRPSERPERFDRVIQSWDTANTAAEWSAYSVCTTWGIKDKDCYLLDVFRERLIYPDLKKAVLEQAMLYDPSVIYIEEHASGVQLVQELTREGFGRLRAIKPKCDKETRMINQTALLKHGFVHIPEEAPWLADYLHEMVTFPNSKYWDQIDLTSQALDAVNRPKNAQGWLDLAREHNAAKAAREAGRGTDPLR